MRLLALLFMLTACTGQITMEVGSMRLTSPEFGHNGVVDKKYTCQGVDISPPLVIHDVPEAAKSLVLILDDPDAPNGAFVHWVVWNIPIVEKIDEGTLPAGAVEGLNSFKRHEYGGPCPPEGTHRYYFRLYALDTTLDISPDSNKEIVVEAMDGHVIAETELMGHYAKR